MALLGREVAEVKGKEKKERRKVRGHTGRRMMEEEEEGECKGVTGGGGGSGCWLKVA